MQTKVNPSGKYIFYGLLKLTRAHNLTYIALTQYFVAIFLSSLENIAFKKVLDPNLFLIVLSTTLIAAAGYIINDYYDIKVDLINKPNRVVVGKIFRRRVALAAHTTFNFLGIILGLIVYWKIGVLNFVCAFLLWFYSNHLKRLPLVGNLCIGLLTSATIFVIGFYYQSNKEIIYLYSILAFSISFIREILKDFEDMKGDITFGSKTLPIIWGTRKTKLFIYVVTFLFIVGFIVWLSTIRNYTLINIFLVLLIPGVYFLYRLYWADTVKEFSFLTTYCKYMMLAGVVSMVFFHF